jgi:hypothetical protein
MRTPIHRLLLALSGKVDFIRRTIPGMADKTSGDQGEIAGMKRIDDKTLDGRGWVKPSRKDVAERLRRAFSRK